MQKEFTSADKETQTIVLCLWSLKTREAPHPSELILPFLQLASILPALGGWNRKSSLLHQPEVDP